jgi:uroporphyrinogen decarboxylase
MNFRERFLNCMHFKPVDRVPYWWFGAWPATVDRWHKEGLPKDVHLERFFGLDRRTTLDIKFGMVPAFDKVLINEDQTSRTIIDERGVRAREFKERTETSMPQFLEFPVKTRKDFLEIKKRYDPSSPARFPVWWEDDVRALKSRTYPVSLYGGRDMGFLGPVRGWTGLKGLMVLIHTDPGLVHEMMEFLADFFSEIATMVLRDVQVDYVVFWEDMAYKTGPLISPKAFNEFMVPCYKQVTGILRENGVDVVMVDSDGYINDLIPLWMKAGVDTFYPLEVQAGMDPVALRKQYGNKIGLIGGIDKRVFARTKEEIEDEVRSKVPYLVGKGGYIPTPDHSVPPDVPYDNFQHYLSTLREACEASG